MERIASQVYTQDGELVFENTDFEPNVPSEGWNGSVRGQKLEGAYKVIVKIINADGTEVTDDIIICSLQCQLDFISVYSSQNLDFNNCRWGNQHNGVGGFDATSVGEDCR